MKQAEISVREIEIKDIEHIIQYWLGAAPAYLKGMGVDLNKLPGKARWTELLVQALGQGYREKENYYIIWQADNKPVGHSNLNKITYGKEAHMHLHLWDTAIRQKGLGTRLVKRTLPFFFGNFGLKKLYCEPYALNPAPNKTLPKAGFTFVRTYVTIPGWINFEQPVNLWELGYEAFQKQQQTPDENRFDQAFPG